MKEPKLIYKYTHAEALANGELRLLPILREKDRMCMPKYVGYRLDEQLRKHGVSDEQVQDAIHDAFDKSQWRYSSGRRFTVRSLPVVFDLVPGQQIGDDDDNQNDEGDDILTCVLEGES